MYKFRLWCRAGGLINTGTTRFVKNVSTGYTIMSAPTKWHMLRMTTTEKNLVNVVLHEDKWCKYHWQAGLTLCLWIQPWLCEAVDPCWLSGGQSWTKASGALAGCFLGLPACLTCYCLVLSEGQNRNRSKSTETEAISLALIQCLIRTSKD